MADDIIITTQGGNATQGSGAQQANTNQKGSTKAGSGQQQANSNQGGSNIVSGQQAGANSTAQPSPLKKPSTEDSPVIDLRELDALSAKGSPSTQTAQGTQAGQGTPLPPPPPPSQGTSLTLEDEALMAGQNVAGPPEKFVIPTLVKEKFPDLAQLIRETESMNDEERDYWFQILPIMTEEQIRKFQDILLNEKAQLNRLDKEYESELNRLNEKHMIEWKEFEAKEKRKVLTEAEQKSREEEKAAEEDLMKRLSQT